MKTMNTRQGGSIMLESLLAILIFSLGILSIVALLGASIKSTTNAKYRADASLLANQVIASMWIGDKTNAVLISSFASANNGAGYVAWKANVTSALPGAAANPPTITIDSSNRVNVTVFWSVPGESTVNKYLTIAIINS
ncbi:MAG: hypothetical protein V4632_09470 [Pseudomonadota bacterium]